MKRSRAGMIGFGVGCYLVFVYLFFPLDTLVTQAISHASKGIPGFELKYKRISPSILFDTQLEDVTLLKADATGAMSPFLSFKEVSINPSYVSLIRGRLALDLEAQGKTGSVDISFSQSGHLTDILVNLDGLGLDVFPSLQDMYALNLKGKFYGKAKVLWNQEKVANSTGELTIEFRDFTLLPSKVNIPIPGSSGPGIPISLPQIRFSGKENSAFEATISKGQIQVTRFDLSGDDFELAATGKVSNIRRIAQMRFALKGEFGFISEEVAKQFAIVLAQFDNQKNKEGKYPISLSGTIERPQIKIGRQSVWPMK